MLIIPVAAHFTRPALTLAQRHNISMRGDCEDTIIFAHGFGCDQNMWRFVAPAFEDRFKTVLFDNVGAGNSDLSAYSFDKYASLHGYADDLIEIVRDLKVSSPIFVGHSVSAMVGLLAQKKSPGLFRSLILVGPSPCYINDDSYVGGFTRDQLEELLETLEDNHLGWSASMAPVIMGNGERPELGEELSASFCRTDPDIAAHFARVTFMSDHRSDLGPTGVPTLILQCSSDVIAPPEVGEFVRSQIPGSTLVKMKATGHCPNLSAPQETVRLIREFLSL